MSDRLLLTDTTSSGMSLDSSGPLTLEDLRPDRRQFSDRPKSPIIMNNDNIADDFGEIMDIDFPADSIPAEIMEECEKTIFDDVQVMPVIAGEHNDPPPVEQQQQQFVAEIPQFNNQAELRKMEFDMNKLQVNNTRQSELTLTQLTDEWSKFADDENYGIQEEKMVYEDLSSYRNPQPEVGGANDGQFVGQFNDFEPDQKSGFFDWQQNQPIIQVNRMEMVQDSQLQYPYENGIFETKPQFLPSSQCSPSSQSIADYYPKDNNTNCSPQEFVTTVASKTRSRKSSMTSNAGKGIGGKRIIGKVISEDQNPKPFRTRMTKAKKSTLTEKQLRERHLEQNKNNAKKCVEKKNNLKQELAEKEILLKKDLQMIEKHNKIQENGLLEAYEFEVYPQYQNNAPFGKPNVFLEEMENCKREIQVDNNGRVIEVAELKKDYDAKNAKYQSYQKPKEDPDLPQNTYASQKSRAKTAYELAKLQYSTANLELECEKAIEFGRILEQNTKIINAHLSGMRRQLLSEQIFYAEFEQFEPS